MICLEHAALPTNFLLNQESNVNGGSPWLNMLGANIAPRGWLMLQVIVSINNRNNQDF
jgi:hypothetical protein